MTDAGKFPKINGNIFFAEDANASYYQGILSTTGAYGNVTISSTATIIRAANSSRKKILIKNNGTQTVYIGVSGVTTSTGIPLSSSVNIVLNTDDVIYGITSTSTSDIRYIEVE